MFSPVSNFYEHSQNETVSIENLNEELWILHIPAVIFVLICVILGFFGNSLVVYIYSSKKFRRSNHRYFILCLAFLDLIGCLIGGSHMTYSLRMPYLMTSTAICKISRYIHHLVNQGSAFLLVVIAIERFNKLCRPFKIQFSHRQTRLQCVLSVSFSALVSFPAAVLYGSSTISTGVRNITGTTCFITDEFRGSTFSTIYMIYLLFETVLITIVIGVLYTFIILKIWSYRNLALSDSMHSEHALQNAESDGDKICSHSLEEHNDNDQNLARSNSIDKDSKMTCTEIKDGDINEKDVTSGNDDILAGKCSNTMHHAINIGTITFLGTDSLNRVKKSWKNC
ncbi:hypothetical protein CHS0354_040462 [Potamilus streckersoni]|uniref:G-protein coupled receptors family 1 profile domain-containing protein n=1 Tax=Potamilus streckersoni TaxID=2493646 RepID=A0AAE0T000_9BIVA|nr:hypothetical protein CHS0354_040462 [Potamilus streckersoni]